MATEYAIIRGSRFYATGNGVESWVHSIEHATKWPTEGKATAVAKKLRSNARVIWVYDVHGMSPKDQQELAKYRAEAAGVKRRVPIVDTMRANAEGETGLNIRGASKLATDLVGFKVLPFYTQERAPLTWPFWDAETDGETAAATIRAVYLDGSGDGPSLLLQSIDGRLKGVSAAFCKVI